MKKLGELETLDELKKKLGELERLDELKRLEEELMMKYGDSET